MGREGSAWRRERIKASGRGAGDRVRTTEWFLTAQPRRARPRGRIRRSFLQDEAGILLGVELGLGRAVKPRHTIPRGAQVRIDTRYVPVRKPVFLQLRQQRYYGRLHAAVRERIEASVREGLR